jgi:hypothetical protein
VGRGLVGAGRRIGGGCAADGFIAQRRGGHRGVEVGCPLQDLDHDPGVVLVEEPGLHDHLDAVDAE